MLIKNYFILGLIAALAFAGCKEDDNKGNSPYSAPYANLSESANKANLENAGIEMLNEMDAMVGANAIAVSIHLSELSENLLDGNGSSSFMSPMKAVSLLGSKRKDPKVVFNELKSATEEPATLTETWDELVGTYSWNEGTKSWDFTEGGNAIILKFPGLEGDESNTAVYTVSNFAFIDVTDPVYNMELDGSPLQLPTSINANLTYNGVQLISYNLSASYQNNGFPTMISAILSLDQFVFSANLKHSVNIAGVITYSLKHAGKALVELHAEVTGNWSKENIENNTDTIREVYYTDESGNDYYNEWTEVYAENIITQANAYFQLLGIKIVAKIDYANLIPAMRKTSKKYNDLEGDFDYMTYMEEMADIYNKFMKLVVVYADNNQKIAQAGFYAYEVNNDWGNKTYSMEMKFVFADGSIVDAETYFGTGFSGLEVQINDFINSIEEEYDMTIDPVEF